MIPFSRDAQATIIAGLVKRMTADELDAWLCERHQIELVVEIHLGSRVRYGWLKDAGLLTFVAETDDPERWVERLVDVMDLDHPFHIEREEPA